MKTKETKKDVVQQTKGSVDSSALNIKKLETVVNSVLQLYSSSKGKEMFKSLDNRARFFSTVAKLLNKSVKLLLRQNTNTYSNKIFVDQIIKVNRELAKAGYEWLKGKAQAYVMQKNLWSYDSVITKINWMVNKLQDDQKLKKAFGAAVKAKTFSADLDKYKLVMLNQKIRNVVSKEVSLLDAVNNARKPIIKEKKIEHIYNKIIMPLLQLFSSEKVFAFNKVKSLQAMITEVVKYGAYKLSDSDNDIKSLNAKLKLTYGPKEAVLNHPELFGYKGVIWTKFTETIGKSEITIDSWKEYFEKYVASNNYIVSKSKEKMWLKVSPVEKPTTVLFYPKLKQFVLNSNLKVFKEVEGLIDSMIKEYQSKNIDDKIIASIKKVKVGNSIITIQTDW